ncbi:MAG: hydrogenase maturation nickel metallochaperone HypA [Gemmatimonadota bacterium]|nr:hydrogenase maturation nickel metallochaperone HypA [Gemmatimonadota bacterium]
MHELSIAESVLEIVEQNKQEKGFDRLTGITLRIGLLSAVDEDALRFAFEALFEGEPYQGAIIEVEKTYPLAKCSCGKSFKVDDMIYACPRCGAFHAELTGGDELEVIRLEVE